MKNTVSSHLETRCLFSKNFTKEIEMPRKIINTIFIFLFFGISCVYMSFALLSPKDKNEYENRKADKFPILSWNSVTDGSFQNSVEKAFNDQIPFAEDMKKNYNLISSSFKDSFLKKQLEENPFRYFAYNNLRLFGSDHIVFWTLSLDTISDTTENLTVRELLDKKAKNLNKAVKKNRDADFYLYFIEKDTDIDFETGEKLGAYEYLKDNLSKAYKCAKYEIPDYETFRENFYLTDHHWNHIGAYKGYLELHELLGIDEPVIVPGEEKEIMEFSGSKVKFAGVEGKKEMMYAYEYDLPEMDFVINGVPKENYGTEHIWFSDAEKPQMVSYSEFYGGDEGEIIISTDAWYKDRLLILGESFDNSVLKLIAAHYNKLYAVDLRYYKAYMGKDFSISEYLKENNIGKVLLMGNVDYFTMSDFNIGEE